MRRWRLRGPGTVLAACLLVGPAMADNWPQFRGPNGSGRPQRELPLPEVMGPGTHVRWKVALPFGHSSPVVHGNRLYLTGLDDQKRLLTMAFERQTGSLLWQAEAPYRQLEEIHSVGSHATPSVATDGQRVVSFFGSSGLYCHDANGKLLWKLPMGPFKNDFGAGTSPIIVDDRVILCQDHDTDSFLMAVDKTSGKVLWKTDRSEFPRNFCTPIIWEVQGKKQIVVAATLRIAAYDFETGNEIWTVGGVARIINMSPVVGDDGILYVACWSPGAEANDRITTPPFAQARSEFDANANGTLEKEELPEGAVKQRYSQIDRDKDGRITELEYTSMRDVFERAHNVVLAIRPGGRGDITQSHVLWRYERIIPYCPSPVWYRDRIFMIKNGGILTVLDAKTGKPLKEGRISATGDYYASPVASDGKVILLSQPGRLTVLSSDDGFDELSSSDLGESVFASPAIADGQVFVRTAGHLYCFELPGK